MMRAVLTLILLLAVPCIPQDESPPDPKEVVADLLRTAAGLDKAKSQEAVKRLQEMGTEAVRLLLASEDALNEPVTYEVILGVPGDEVNDLLAGVLKKKDPTKWEDGFAARNLLWVLYLQGSPLGKETLEGWLKSGQYELRSEASQVVWKAAERGKLDANWAIPLMIEGLTDQCLQDIELLKILIDFPVETGQLGKLDFSTLMAPEQFPRTKETILAHWQKIGAGFQIIPALLRQMDNREDWAQRARPYVFDFLLAYLRRSDFSDQKRLEEVARDRRAGKVDAFLADVRKWAKEKYGG